MDLYYYEMKKKILAVLLWAQHAKCAQYGNLKNLDTTQLHPWLRLLLWLLRTDRTATIAHLPIPSRLATENYLQAGQSVQCGGIADNKVS